MRYSIKTRAFSLTALILCASLSLMPFSAQANLCEIFLQKGKSVAGAPLSKLESFYYRMNVQRGWSRLDWNKYGKILESLRPGGKVSKEDESIENQFAILAAAVETLPKGEKDLSIESIINGDDWSKKFALYHIVHGTAKKPVQAAWEIGTLSYQKKRKVSEGITSWQARKILRELYLLHEVPFSAETNLLEFFSKELDEKAIINLDRFNEFQIREYGLRLFLKEKVGINAPNVMTKVEAFLDSDAGHGAIAVTSNLKLLDGYGGKAPTYTALKISKYEAGRMYHRVMRGEAAMIDEEKSEYLSDSKLQLRSNAVTSALAYVLGLVTVVTAYRTSMSNEREKGEKIANEVIENLKATTALNQKRLKTGESLDYRERAALRWVWAYMDKNRGNMPSEIDPEWIELKKVYFKGTEVPEEERAKIETALKTGGFTNAEAHRLLFGFH